MKKLFFVAALSLGLMATTTAQETYFGTKAGLNLANLAGDDIEGNSMLIGFSVGGFASIGISEAFSVQPELLYSTKGSSFDEGGDYVLSYIDIPIMAKYNVSDEIHFELGPQIGLLMAADADGNDVKEFFSGTDIGLAVGGGYTLESGIDLSLRYATSLSTITEDSEGDVKNTVIQVAVGYRF